MAVEFRLNPGLADAVRRSPEVRALVRQMGERVGEEAQRLGQEVAPSYETRVEDEGDGVRVVARTGGINAAGWIELGTGAPTPTPAYAPLRRGAEAAGLRTEGGR